MTKQIFIELAGLFCEDALLIILSNYYHDKKNMVCVTNNSIRVLLLDDMHLVKLYESELSFTKIIDNKLFIMIRNSTVMTINLNTFQYKLIYQQVSLEGVSAFDMISTSESQYVIVAGSTYGRIVIWNLIEDNMIFSRELNGNIGTIKSLKIYKNQLLSASCDDVICSWDLNSGICSSAYIASQVILSNITFNNEYIMFGVNIINIQNLETGICMRLSTINIDKITIMYIYKNMIITGHYNGSIKIWDLHTGNYLKCLGSGDNRHARYIEILQIYGNILISVDRGSLIKAWLIIDFTKLNVGIEPIYTLVHDPVKYKKITSLSIYNDLIISFYKVLANI